MELTDKILDAAIARCNEPMKDVLHLVNLWMEKTEVSPYQAMVALAAAAGMGAASGDDDEVELDDALRLLAGIMVRAAKTYR